MNHRGVGGSSAQKVHPFFAHNHSSSLAAGSTGQSFAFDKSQDPGKEASHSIHTAKRRKTSKPNRPSSKIVDHAEASNSGSARDVSTAGWVPADPRPDQSLSKQALQNHTSSSTKPRKVPATPELPTVSHASISAESGASSCRSASLVTKGSESSDASSGRAPLVKKMLKFNTKTGTLGSPPKTKQKKDTPSRLLVCVRYGNNEVTRREMGLKIAQILNGELQLPKFPTQPQPGCKSVESDKTSAKSASSKTTHPFFMGKSKPPKSSTPSRTTDSAPKSPSRKHSIFTSTPMSPQKPKNPFLSTMPNKVPLSGIRSGATKVPGAKYPLWPPNGMSHVRGDGCAPLPMISRPIRPARPKKFKGHVTTIRQTESVLQVVMEHIDMEKLRRSLPRDEDSFIPVPSELRVPQRHFESGLKLQHRIRPQLSVQSPLALAGKEDIDQDELAGPPAAAVHPAISRHYVSLAKQLSAFDRSTCESMAWSQKYAPVSAVQVLQRGTDAAYIRDWLEAMKVQSVEKSSSDSAGERTKANGDGVPKKKRKKNKVDDFIVDTDEEESELEEIAEEGDDEADSGAESWQAKKSVARSINTKSKEGGKLRNTIVLSGPHGCGKTAAVYAVAKELDFEVFEINPGSRRSGKDILDRIGDMTRNHLVQHHRAQAAPIGAGDSSDMTAGSESRPSQQQGIMTSFFKAKTAKTGKPGSKAKSKQQSTKSTASPRGQKQSLILIEEADILYEEDKQLWTTLMGMIDQSRRPFVITCNDESLLPLESLDLHGIFRFAPPPTVPAVDLCILIAANEGHILCRGAVEALYQSRHCDLRATICDLNFWCQIGVGDRRGGFDWFYSRWPKGCDLDERGNVVRVLSQDTYQHGMGWIGRDAVLSERSGLETEREVLQQLWNFWHVDLGDWCRSQPLYMRALERVIHRASGRSDDKHKKVAALEAWDEFCTAQSDADLLSDGIFAEHLKEKLDPSLPETTTRAREDYIIGRNLLDAQEAFSHTTNSQSISLALKSAAREQLSSASQRILKVRDGDRSRLHCPPLDEPTAVAKLDASLRQRSQDMTRLDISYAFDPIAVAPKSQATSYLEPSVFDRTMPVIVVDVAPWIRGIIAFEEQLMQERRKLNSLLGGGTRKRMRNTRSAYSALEGGERRRTRKDRYFGEALTTSLVMRTGGRHDWQEAVAELMREGSAAGGEGEGE
ncbi:hypothetical protein E4U23_003353 [Claviceps purpurea]|nr:hypothetical protein E4U23_003353 [Claviceps purpurea]